MKPIILDGWLAIVYNGEEDKLHFTADRILSSAKAYNEISTLISNQFSRQNDFEVVEENDWWDLISKKRFRITIEEIE